MSPFEVGERPGGSVPVRILRRTDRWVAVDKPSGLFVHRSRLGPDRDVLLQRVRDALGRWVSPVHRLDRPTSGAVLFGFDAEAVRDLQEALHRPSTRKLYLALVRGIVEPALVVERPLSSTRAGSREPQEARTEVRRLAVLGGRVSLVLLRPTTGRRHQLRRHLGGLGHHVLGDVRYGKGRVNRELRERVGLERLALHAWRLELDLGDGEGQADDREIVEAPWPEDLAPALGAWLAPEELEGILESLRRRRSAAPGESPESREVSGTGDRPRQSTRRSP